MSKRRVIAVLYALALALAIPAHIQAMDCYPGKLVRDPQGYNYCEPFIGNECLYCEVVDKG